MRDRLERVLGWVVGVIHLAAFLTFFTIGHRLQHESLVSDHRNRWDPVHEQAVLVAIWSAAAAVLLWFYGTFRRRPYSVLISLLWLLWLCLLLLGRVGAAGAGVFVG
jgi:hypothetical protein